ncbi:MAG: diaminopropionate ammonia-lyase, partial [Paenibacillaceae bacterium]
MENLKWKYNERAGGNDPKASTQLFNSEDMRKVWKFHKSFKMYKPTPLRNLSQLSSYLGVSDIYVKDESYRFGLNAFKVLGGTYAIGQYLAQRLNMKIEELSFDMLKSREMKEKLGEITFITATDGNHGRGVAWAAQQLGQKAVVYMPKGSSQIRLDNIRATGAEACITELNYDECVRLCVEQARQHGWVVIQDTAWKGYQDIPTWIMQGYTTIVMEVLEQLQEQGKAMPTHIFVQAGVGSYAGAIQGFLASLSRDRAPRTVVVEPNQADCIFQSAMAEDGFPRYVTGHMDTIMAGLACGEPNPIAWNILKDYSEMFISCPDVVAALGMRILGNPLGDDSPVISGESGAVTTGLLYLLMRSEKLKEVKELLGLDKDSKILLINTEGDTDPIHYRKVVWEGCYPYEESIGHCF